MNGLLIVLVSAEALAQGVDRVDITQPRVPMIPNSVRGINMQLSGSAHELCRFASLGWLPDRGDVTQIVSELDKTGDGGGDGGPGVADNRYKQCAQAKSASTSSWRPANVLGETASGTRQEPLASKCGARALHEHPAGVPSAAAGCCPAGARCSSSQTIRNRSVPRLETKLEVLLTVSFIR